MEEPHSVQRRKKRKTRRCLNEIRKKSHRNANDASKNIELRSKSSSNLTKAVASNSNNFVTSNRLTLAIFPKAIQSETITRPLLAELRHEPGNVDLNNILKSKYTLKTKSTLTPRENMNSSDTIKNVITLISDGDSDDSRGKMVIEGDSGILKTESPSDIGNERDASTAEEASPGPAPRGAAAASPTTPGDRQAYRMYQQFVKNIPKYLQIYAPSLLVEDAMKKPKAILHSMYSDSRRSLLDSDRLALPPHPAPPAAIVENPRDYIKLWGARASPPSPASPASHSTSPPPSPAAQPPHSIIQDTPEYTYFPHKLNQ